MPERRIIDISRSISERTAVWPGDTTFSRRPVMQLAQGCSCNVSTYTLSAHTGSHADAPRHFVEGAADSAQCALDAYWGPCLVVATRNPLCVSIDDIAGIDLAAEQRLLFRTPNAPADDVWNDDFSFIHPDVARAAAQAGVRLLGIDTPSVDPMTSKTLETHKLLLRGRVAILESLDLSAVPPGRYELCALPLKIDGGDASPVRAVLRVLG